MIDYFGIFFVLSYFRLNRLSEQVWSVLLIEHFMMVRMINRVKTAIANLYFNFLLVEEKLGYMFLGTSLKNVNPVVILPAVDTVMDLVISKLKKKTVHGSVYNGMLNHVDVSVIQTHMGSPAAAIIMEVIKNCSCKAAIRIDFCGGLQSTWHDGHVAQTRIDVGSLVIPKTVVLSDGTSFQYLQKYAAQIATHRGAIATHRLFHALCTHCAIYLLGALFNIPVISVLAVSNLRNSEEASMFRTKKIPPGTLQGMDDAVNLLCGSLSHI